jgi:2-polyprenyl-6-methoxyphenol hydroxylase-like FAD-dependent oxidoreductase
MRDKLNQILLSKLAGGTVQGNRKLVDVEQRANGMSPAVCKFSDGSSEEFDVVIGCDGINSVVRRHVVGAESPATYSGIRLGAQVIHACILLVAYLCVSH